MSDPEERLKVSAEKDHVRALAERIARRVSQSEGEDSSSPADLSSNAVDELAHMRRSLEELKRKLATIEEHLSQDKDDAYARDAHGMDEQSAPQQERREVRPPSSARSPWLSGVYVPATHPSQERFGVEEAAVSELVDYFEKEKVCEIEPGGKPCTHCDMCSTRGF